MKIAFVLDDSLDKTDGVQQYMTTLGEWMRHRGHDVHYLVGYTERRDIKNIHSISKNIQVHFNQNRMSTPLPTTKKRIKDILDKHNFDVIHVQLPYSPFLAAKIIKLAPKQTAIIGTFHILPFSALESLATRILATMVRSSRRRFDEIISVSIPAAKFAKKRFKVKSRVIPNVVDVAAFRNPKIPRIYQDGKTNIVYLGRLVERKGCMHFLKAIALLHERNELPNTRVIVAGKGPLLKNLEDFVKKQKLSKVVHFTGYVSEQDKPGLLGAANIAVLPSLGGESFGIVLIEAMAAGAEVVLAGNNQGYRSVMAGHKNQLVDPSDTEEFAKTIKNYLFKIQLRYKAKKWQESHVVSYDVKMVGPQILDIYLSVLAKKPKPKS